MLRIPAYIMCIYFAVKTGFECILKGLKLLKSDSKNKLKTTFKYRALIFTSSKNCVTRTFFWLQHDIWILYKYIKILSDTDGQICNFFTSHMRPFKYLMILLRYLTLYYNMLCRDKLFYSDDFAHSIFIIHKDYLKTPLFISFVKKYLKS